MEDVFKVLFRESMDSGGALIAIDSRDGRVIGSSRFFGYDEDASEIEIGWTFLARTFVLDFFLGRPASKNSGPVWTLNSGN